MSGAAGTTVTIRRPHRRGGEPIARVLCLQIVRSRPHRRGGEPKCVVCEDVEVYVVPTGVGVNRSAVETPYGLANVVPTGVGVNRVGARGRAAGLASSPQAWG